MYVQFIHADIAVFNSNSQKRTYQYNDVIVMSPFRDRIFNKVATELNSVQEIDTYRTYRIVHACACIYLLNKFKRDMFEVSYK